MAEIKWIKKYEKKVRVIPSPPKPQTNADRIRSMSDEELAEYISHFCDCDRGDCPVYTSSINCGIGCKQAWLNWLRRGAEDGRT